MDEVILPVAAYTAVPEGWFKHYGRHIAHSLQVHLTFASYEAVPGALDYTTGSIPVTFADEIVDPVVFKHAPVNNKDTDNWVMCKAHLMPSMQVGRLTKAMQITGAFLVDLLLVCN